MALSLTASSVRLIYETGHVSRSSVQSHIVPRVALAIFPNSLHVCRERQIGLQWKKGRFTEDIKYSICSSLDGGMRHRIYLFMGTFPFQRKQKSLEILLVNIFIGFDILFSTFIDHRYSFKLQKQN